jgi:hypothetical protein
MICELFRIDTRIIVICVHSPTESTPSSKEPDTSTSKSRKKIRRAWKGKLMPAIALPRQPIGVIPMRDHAA